MPMTMDEMQTFVPRALRLARRKADLSVEELAGKAGISSQAVQKHEDGINLPQLDVFIRELTAMSLDFGSFHELLTEARVVQRLDDLENRLQTVTLELETIRESLSQKSASDA